MKSPSDELNELQQVGLLRELKPLESASGIRITRNGQELWNFASNDYLGLARHPQIEAAIIDGVKQYGAGSAASRLVAGTLPPHQQLEATIAEAKQSEAALTFSSGFATSLGAIPAIVGKDDFIIIDKLSHACLVDASLLSGATLRVFPHNDLTKLKKLLSGIREKSADARILIATESVFSMDGDLCPLREIVELAEEYDAFLMLDEAHGFGVLGENGMGLAEQEDLQSRITFQMGTLSKAAGLSGGYIATSRAWADLLINRARSFIYSTAPPPAIAHAAIESINLIRSTEGKSLRGQLQKHIDLLGGHHTPIIPIVLGTNEATIEASQTLNDQGFLVPAIRFPTVPRNTARLRVSLSAAHPTEAVQALAGSLPSS